MDDFVRTRLRPLAPGLVCTFFAILYGFGLAAVFSGDDRWLKDKFREDAMAVFESKYDSNKARVDGVCAKAWVYFKRAHVYSGGLGAFALPVILLLALVRTPGLTSRLAAFQVGSGAILYGMYWMFVALKAPSVASTAVAAKSLAWLSFVGGGAAGLGVLLAIGVTLTALFRPQT